MHRIIRGWFVIGALYGLGARAAGIPQMSSDAAYIRRIEVERTERVTRLTRPDGWLSLVGLFFLEPGSTTVGSAPANAVILPKGPRHLGTVRLEADGRCSITLNPAADATVDGRQVLSAPLDPRGGEASAPVVRSGTVSFFVIERVGRKALRVKDSASDLRIHFQGLDYFPIDPSWRIEAEWIPFERAREVTFQNIIGQASRALVPGKAVFTRDGQTFELLPLVESADEPLLFVISDLTSGDQTYAAARFVEAEPPRDGRIVLDFNLAVNPPCAFTSFATCPLPPPENRLPIAVRAGEKKYRGSHD